MCSSSRLRACSHTQGHGAINRARACHGNAELRREAWEGYKWSSAGLGGLAEPMGRCRTVAEELWGMGIPSFGLVGCLWCGFGLLQ